MFKAENIISFTVYFLSFVVSLISYNKTQTLNKKINFRFFLVKNSEKIDILINTFKSFFILILMAAFRYDVGTDYLRYLGFFTEQIPLSVFETKYTGVEYTFRAITKMISAFSQDRKIFFGFWSFLMFLLIYIFFENTKKELIAGPPLFLILCTYYGMSYNIIKQTVSMCFILVSFYFLIEKDIIKYFITVLFATLFHNSAAVFFPFYFLHYFENKKIRRFFRGIVIILLIFFPIYYKYPIILSGLYNDYTRVIRFHYSGFIYLFEKIMIGVPSLLMLRDIDRKYRILTYFIIIDFAITIPVFYFSYFYRITYYFIPVYGIIYGRYIFQHKYNDGGAKIYIYIYSTLYFIIHYILLGNHGIIPYKVYDI